MSSGHENKQGGMKMIMLDPEEFNEVVKRVHGLLQKRVESARKRNDSHHSDRAERNHVETAKDMFVFVHMMDLIEHMSGEISELRDFVSEAESSDTPLPEMFTSKKTEFPN